jgi:flavin reductase (DIM6/NTAB) family NADH-FMN oxidoreductase RutF
MKQLIRRWLLGPRVIPHYVLVGLPEPQNEVRVFLRGAGVTLEVTASNVVVALRPLHLALALSHEQANLWQSVPVELVFCDAYQPDTTLGIVRLSQAGVRQLANQRLCIFQARGSVNHCVPRWRAATYYWYRWWSGRLRGDPYNPQMSRSDLHSFLVLCTSPRPVALLTIPAPGNSAMVVADLSGYVLPQVFVVALPRQHSTTKLARTGTHLVLSRVPVDMADTVYRLEQLNGNDSSGSKTVPVETRLSPTFGLPVPSAAISAIELAVEQSFDVGSHTVLVTQVVSESSFRDGLCMHHVQGFYHDWRRRKGWEWPGTDGARHEPGVKS